MSKNIKMMTTTALFVALSIIIAYFEIPIVPAFPFLKVDFAQAVLIVCAMLLGTGAGICAQIVNAVICLFITGTASAGVGTAFNLVLGILFILLYRGALRFVHNRFRHFIALGVACVLCIFLACLLNYIGVVPVYKMIGMVPQNFDAAYFVIAGALPLNLVKWPLNALLAGTVFQAVKHYMP